MGCEEVGVVITGGDFQGLGVLRTFGEKRIPIVLLDSEPCIARYSIHKKTFFKSPSPQQEEVYTDFLLDLGRKRGLQGWVIIPNSDQIVRVVSRNKERLETCYRVPVPPWSVIQSVYIKEQTYKVAEKHHIPVPKTFYANSLDEMMQHNLPYPVIIKPSIRDNFFPKAKVKALLVRNVDELAEKYTIVSRIIKPNEILVQEYIVGGPRNLYSFCPFFKNGKSVASIMARRARQHPMDFGQATTYAEIVDIPEMRFVAEKFLSLIGYYGIAEVEFMFDQKEGVYKLIEVNPRVWGWHSLAIHAGLDLPYFLFCDMIGWPFSVPNKLADVKWVRLLTDIPTVVKEMIAGKLSFREYIKTMKGKKRDAVLSLRDPLPFLAEILLLPYLYKKRGF